LSQGIRGKKYSWWALEGIALVTPKLTQTQEDKRNNDKVSSDNPVSMCKPMF